MMISSSSLINRLFHDDRIILTLFALYGMVGGGIAYAWKLSSESGDIFSLLYVSMNIPVLLMLAFIEVSFGNPLGFLGSSYPVMLIPLYAILWLFIGLVVYGIVRMLRLQSNVNS